MAKPAFDPSKPFEKTDVKADKPPFDPSKAFEKGEDPGIGSKILGALSTVSRGLDSVTGAPTRAAISAAQNANSLGDIPGGALSAFVKQFADNPDNAPTGEAIVEKAGVPHGMASKALGVAMDLGANPLNFAAPAAKVASKVIDAASPVTDALGSLAAKAGSIVTGKPKHAIEVYAGRGGEVTNLLDKYGGEIPAAADEMKKKVLENIAQTKKVQGDIIEKTLAGKENVSVPTQPIIDELSKVRARINPHYHPGDIAQIDDMVNAITQTAPQGQMPLADLFETKKFLQTRGQNAYVRNGELFSTGAEAQKAAAKAGAKAREILHQSSPEIAHADEVYTALHDLDDKMSSALLGQGKSENVFASAGSGKQNIHQSMLKKIGDITGTDPVGDAEILNSAKHFRENDIRSGIMRALLDTKRGAGRAYDALPVGAISAGGNAGLKALSEIEQAMGHGPMRGVAGGDSPVKRRLNGQ